MPTPNLPVLNYTRETPHGIEDVKPYGESTLMIIKAAQDNGVRYYDIPGSRLIALEYKGITRYLHRLMPSQTTELAYHVCLDKVATRAFLQRGGIKLVTAYYIMKKDPESAWMEIYEALQKPVVVKPTLGMQGKSVYMNIDSPEAFKKAVRESLDFDANPKSRVLVEETAQGTEYRVLATRDKVIGIINREPANVVGDGSLTIQELIDQKNTDPRRSDDHNDALCKIKVDAHVQEFLQQQNLSTDFVPEAGQKVYLRKNSNISTGGDSHDVTDTAHPSVIELCLQVMRSIPGLEIAGIDLITNDITAEQSEGTYNIIEVNCSPGICIHEAPYSGEPKPAGLEFLMVIFPELRADLGL